MRRFVSFGPAAIVIVTMAATLLAVPRAIRDISAATTAATVAVAQRELDNDDVLERINKATRNIAEAVEPSVVHLEVYGGRRTGRGASGSGWMFDDLGHIVTNAHVVSGASSVMVQFFDGRVMEGEVVGADPTTDIAVVRVDPGAYLLPARRATGQPVRRGDRVYAFGSPFGFKFSMSEGIVSGLGRSAQTMMGFAGISNYIQTDAAVNPGNSGGPLVDVRGRVIGMNVAIATAQESRGTTEGQSAGISFAIPLLTIESRVQQIIKTGTVEPGFLGIAFDDSRTFGEDGYDGRGVRVGAVNEGSAAAEAGVMRGDIITAINGQAVEDGEVMRALIAAARPGDVLELTIWRDGKLSQFKATLGQMPESTRLAQFRAMLLTTFGLGLQDTDRGPVVGMVIRDTPADSAGFEIGMILRRVGDAQVETVEETIRQMQSRDLFTGKSVKMTVQAAPVRGAEEDAANVDTAEKTVTLRLR